MSLRALSLDAHGTLILPEPSVGGIYAAIALRHGVQVDAADIDAVFPDRFRAVRAHWPVPYGCSAEDAWCFWDEILSGIMPGACDATCRRSIFDELGTGRWWRVLPGVRETLMAVRQAGVPIAVCSNFDSRLRGILADLDLGPFQTVVISAEIGCAKPDATMLHRVAEDCGVAATEVLHVGDHQREDGGAAAAAGCAFLPVTPGQGLVPREILQRLG